MRKLSLLSLALLLMTTSCRDVLEEIVDRVKNGDTPNRSEVDFHVLSSIDLGDEGAAEISAFDPLTDKLFVVNNDGDSRIDVVDLHDPAHPSLLSSIDISAYGGGVNSVAVNRGMLAAAIEAEPSLLPGQVVLFDTESLQETGTYTVGSLPDMVTFTPNGRYLLVANEGEPNDEYTIDPEGSVSLIDIKKDVVINLGFGAFIDQQEMLEEDGLRVFGPGASLPQDLEPEYITVSRDSRVAWVALQENNGLARIDLEQKMITDIFPLGFKDYSHPMNAIDVSDEDGTIQFNTWPVLGMYQPDAIESFFYRGVSYVITANEGDARDYDGFSEEERVDDLKLDESIFPDAAELQKPENLGRLKITTTLGNNDDDEAYEQLVSYGARSFAIWDGYTGDLVFDSGNELEELIADAGLYEDGRSDDKGVEPEGVAVGKIKNRTIAFIGLERVDAVMVYDVTDPYAPRFIQILESGDAPEGLIFIPANDSPNGNDLFIVSSEDDGQVLIFEN